MTEMKVSVSQPIPIIRNSRIHHHTISGHRTSSGNSNSSNGSTHHLNNKHHSSGNYQHQHQKSTKLKRMANSPSSPSALSVWSPSPKNTLLNQSNHHHHNNNISIINNSSSIKSEVKPTPTPKIDSTLEFNKIQIGDNSSTTTTTSSMAINSTPIQSPQRPLNSSSSSIKTTPPKSPRQQQSPNVCGACEKSLTSPPVIIRETSFNKLVYCSMGCFSKH
ncbi:hypothetical protein DFA_04609 [Cavenderia fasciculata]|uniref:Uncharacterized protein n=1 Tax=Cavenderia fasciculata TaxID=261658 RepID=F4PQ18_CACFS|nr:uncharacterized protein DFA_04609 [Cavenderia fasciculata]EGG22481.1 hypothetical protein DFA_04609 [Cavenderia fasciculata]|eukprot:XP_004360332.1 hypothetical protein DFA_04609 [Cavenderia fasciculata]